MKTAFEMTLYDNPKNREKCRWANAVDIMFDDMDNELPPEWETINGEPGVDVAWGSKYKFTIEVIEP